MLLLPSYIVIKKEQPKRVKGCLTHHILSIDIFDLLSIKLFWAVIILAAPPLTIKCSKVD